MTKEITNKTKCVLTGTGMEIWISEEQAHNISELINRKTGVQIIELEDCLISINDIKGIYPAQYIYDNRKRRAGMWQCDSCERWHKKGEECGCEGGRY